MPLVFFTFSRVLRRAWRLDLTMKSPPRCPDGEAEDPPRGGAADVAGDRRRDAGVPPRGGGGGRAEKTHSGGPPGKRAISDIGPTRMIKRTRP
eukprot:109972-Pyramimonas_sp.AAC.1